MGCYLSQPDNNVYVTEGRGRKYAYATASCQGWRRDQEDAEAVIPDFEEDASLFILCDGHGGAEVAQYTVEHFPKFLKEQPLYKEGKYKEALEQAFVDFDALLRTPEVHKELVKLSLDGSEKDKAKEDLESKESIKENKSLTSNGSSQTSTANGSDEPSAEKPAQDSAASSTSASNMMTSSSKTASCSSSSVAGPSSSRPDTVADDVDFETLKKEAQLPLAEVLIGYTGKFSGAIAGSPLVRAKKESNIDKGASDESLDDPKPSSSDCAQASSESMREKTMKQVLQRYFKGTVGDDEEGDDGSSSEYDSEFDADRHADADDDDDDEDDDDDDEEEDDDDLTSSEDDDEESDDDDDDDGDDEEDDEEELEEEESYRIQGNEGDNSIDEREQDDKGEHEDDAEHEKLVKKDKRVNLMSLLARGSRRRKRKSKKSENDEDSDSDDEVDDINRLVLTSQVVEKLQLGKMQGRQHKPGIDSGCTVVVTLVKNNKLYAASSGDSRCILIKRSGDCIPMSIDHKPEDKTEYDRIKAAGGEVIDGRVNSGLNLSRAFGDFSYKSEKLTADKQMITPCPDVRVATIDAENLEYIFLACDGIWNSLNNNQTSKFLMKTADSCDHDLVEMCIQLFRKCIAPKTDGDGTGCDNMTCILVRLDKPSDLESSKEQNKELSPSDTKQDLNKKTNDEKSQESKIESVAIDTLTQNDEQSTTNTIKRSSSSSSCTDLMPPKRRCLSL